MSVRAENTYRVEGVVVALSTRLTNDDGVTTEYAARVLVAPDGAVSFLSEQPVHSRDEIGGQEVLVPASPEGDVRVGDALRRELRDLLAITARGGKLPERALGQCRSCRCVRWVLVEGEQDGPVPQGFCGFCRREVLA